MRSPYIPIACVAIAALLAASTPLAQAQMAPVYTYQGQLKDGGRPFDGVAYLEFMLWDSLDSGNQIGMSFWTAFGVDVVDGLFAVEVDATVFGPSAFTGEPRWLQIAVTDPGGGNPIVLSPRQAVNPAPCALFALDGTGTTPWQTNGSGIHYNDGEVGIGTASPSEGLLHVVDQYSNAVVGQCAGESTYGSLGSEYAGVYGVGSFGVMGEAASPTTGFGGYFTGRGYFSGDVGVGVLNPTEKLDVAGTVKMEGLQLGNSATAGHVLTANAGGVGTWQPGGAAAGLTCRIVAQSRTTAAPSMSPTTARQMQSVVRLRAREMRVSVFTARVA